MGTLIKNRGTSCVGVRKTGTTLIRVSTVMGTLYGDHDEVDDDSEEEDDLEFGLAIAGLDRDELEAMDEDERREALEDAGLDPDDYDF